MTVEIAVESHRISRDLARIMRQASVSDEVPQRMTTRDVDAGGAPELAPELIRWIGPVCTCGREAACAPGCRATRWDEHLAGCEPACRINDTKFYSSDHRNHPNRMKKALRQIRRLNPKAYDLVYLVVALHFTYEQATAKLRADDISRGNEPRTDAHFAVLWLSGASMLTAAF